MCNKEQVPLVKKNNTDSNGVANEQYNLEK